ncbi:MAG: HEPN domain-containing protein [Methanobacteriaceae archaeon]|nr:HEPN domain-containing protein [Methanobacteriaceae archaeon]
MDKIDDLYYQGYLKKIEPSPLKSKLSLKEAKIWLKEAEETYIHGFKRSTRICTFYAFYHAARAVTLRDGVSEESYHYLIDYLETYCEKGIFKKECLDILHWIFDLHYQDEHHFQCIRSPQDLEQGIRYCHEFIGNIEVLLEKTGKLPKTILKNSLRVQEEDKFEDKVDHY